jgi:hypothetical protein
VDDLSFDWVVLNSLLVPVDWNVLGEFFLEYLGDVFSLVLDGVVVHDLPLFGDVLDVFLFFVLHDSSLIRDILDSGLAPDGLLLNLDGSLDDLLNLLDDLLNWLDVLLNWLDVLLNWCLDVLLNWCLDILLHWRLHDLLRHV